MALPEILEFPFEAGCPKCRFVVTITEDPATHGVSRLENCCFYP